MEQKIEEYKNTQQDTKPPVGSYEAMKPFFDKVDEFYQEFLQLEKDGLLGKK